MSKNSVSPWHRQVSTVTPIGIHFIDCPYLLLVFYIKIYQWICPVPTVINNFSDRDLFILKFDFCEVLTFPEIVLSSPTCDRVQGWTGGR